MDQAGQGITAAQLSGFECSPASGDRANGARNNDRGFQVSKKHREKHLALCEISRV